MTIATRVLMALAIANLMTTGDDGDDGDVGDSDDGTVRDGGESDYDHESDGA